MWSRVAGLGREAGSLGEDEVLAWAVGAVCELGFEASNLCMYSDDKKTYRVVQARGLPDPYVNGVHSSERGMAHFVERERKTVIVSDYKDRLDVVPELVASGFRTVVATPVWVEMSIDSLLPDSSMHFAQLYRDTFVHSPRTLTVGDTESVKGLRKDRSEFPIEVVLGPIESPEGLVVTATVRDVTERKELERRLAHQATRRLKIDKSLIEALGTRNDAIIGAVVEVARAFDLDVVAEGVESDDQVSSLLGLGCPLGQGFLLGRPVPAPGIERIFRSKAEAAG